MKTSKLFIIFAAIVITSGCASNYTSIKTTSNPNEYYLTEVHQNFIIPPTSTLYKCTANNKKMDCTEVGK